MSMGHWWKDTDKGLLKYSQKTSFQCRCVHHKSHMHWPGMHLRLCRDRLATKASEPYPEGIMREWVVFEISHKYGEGEKINLQVL